MKKRTYEEEANNLAQAVDIAIEAFQKFPPKNFTSQLISHTVDVYSEFKENALHPQPQFKKLVSLKYIVTDVFIYFQEGSGEAVEYFWKKIKENNLPYERENKLQKILVKKKIRTQMEYDYVVDTMVPFQQEGKIDERDAALLSQLLGDFEKRKGKK